MENIERIHRNRNNENVNISLFDTSSSQDLHNIIEFEWGTSVEILLNKSKSESDLKKVDIIPSILKVDIIPSILESYILEYLWKTLNLRER